MLDSFGTVFTGYHRSVIHAKVCNKVLISGCRLENREKGSQKKLVGDLEEGYRTKCHRIEKRSAWCAALVSTFYSYCGATKYV